MHQVVLLDKDELQIVGNGMDVNLSSQAMAMMFMKHSNLIVDPKKLHNYHVKC